MSPSPDQNTDTPIIPDWHEVRAALAQVDLIHVGARLDQQVDHLPLLVGEVGGVGRHLHVGNARTAGRHVVSAGFSLFGCRRAGRQQGDGSGGER